jgi:hypothetical protein
MVELLEDCRRVGRRKGIGEEVGAGRIPDQLVSDMVVAFRAYG